MYLALFEGEELQHQIKELQRYIEGQEVLLDVLEHDGHNVEAERAKLAIEKAKLAGLTSNLRQRLASGFKLFE